MAKALRVLLVEDSQDDALLVARELHRSGFALSEERVQTEPEFLAALGRGEWDIILSDFSMPEFSGLRAFALLRERGLEIPFILVSGRIGEELAADAMRSGVDDYVLKDNLKRLAPAVQRELEETALRRERRDMGRRLGESEEKFRNLIEGSIQCIVIHRDLKPLFVNRALVETFGYGSVEEVLALESVLAPFAPHLHGRLREIARRLRAGERTPGDREFEGVRKDGWRIWLETLSWNVNWEGRPAIQSVCINVTERKRAEETLREQQRLLKTVFDSLPLWVTVKDREGRYLLVNRRLAEALGRPEPEFAGMTFQEIGFRTPEERSEIERLDGEVLETGRGREDPDVAVTLPDGRTHRFHIVRTPLRNESGQVWGMVTAAQDVTAKLSLESQLREAQKMESVGRLAGGVAHDFNNMLVVILAYADTLLARFASDEQAREEIQEIREAGRRAAGLTRQLLAFSRRQILELRPLDLSEVVAGMEKFLGRLIGEDIQTEYRLASGLPAVIADEGQIEQVRMNLIVNARDAMPHGGRLLIETAPALLDEAYASRHAGVRAGEYAQLSVTDTGVGMDEATRLRIFEPFFTTKEEGKGTGLGLATVYGIVNQLGGSIWVYGEPGKGTTFKIYLPFAEAESPAARRPVAEAREPPGTGTILLVEDDPAVRRAAQRILRSAGYRILEADGGGKALELLSGHGQPVDLLLSDVVMPEMGGRELAERIGSIHPGIPVIYMSGYTEDAIVRRGVLEAGTHLLQKPFDRETLLKKVRDALRARSA